MKTFLKALLVLFLVFLLPGCSTPEVGDISTYENGVTETESENHFYIVGIEKRELYAKTVYLGGKEEAFYTVYIDAEGENTVIESYDGRRMEYEELKTGQKIRDMDIRDSMDCAIDHYVARKIIIDKPGHDDLPVNEHEAVGKSIEFINDNNVNIFDAYCRKYLEAVKLDEDNQVWEVMIGTYEIYDSAFYNFKINALTGRIVNEEMLVSKLKEPRITSGCFDVAITVPELVYPDVPFNIEVTVKYSGDKEVHLECKGTLITLTSLEKSDLIIDDDSSKDKVFNLKLLPGDSFEHTQEIAVTHKFKDKYEISVYFNSILANGRMIPEIHGKGIINVKI